MNKSFVLLGQFVGVMFPCSFDEPLLFVRGLAVKPGPLVRLSLIQQPPPDNFLRIQPSGRVVVLADALQHIFGQAALLAFCWCRVVKLVNLLRLSAGTSRNLNVAAAGVVLVKKIILLISTILKAARYRACAPRPSARLRWLRNFFLCRAATVDGADGVVLVNEISGC